MQTADMLAWTLKKIWPSTAAYGDQLTADLTAEQMVAQPRVGGELTVNHPAWVLSHLSAYHPVIVGLLRGETPDDPLHHRYGMKSHPVADAGEYLPVDELRAQFLAGHADVDAALEAATAEVLEAPMPVERWVPKFPQVGLALPYLMLRHEALHLGQVSAWRRVQGLPPTQAS
ncbi:MAG: DinB family protein [Planctomycetota bacterium]